MDRALMKVDSLLRFYYKEGVVISLKVKDNMNTIVKGMIEKKNRIGIKYIIVKPLEKSPIKIFLDEIVYGSIIPIDYLKKENKNNRIALPKQLRYKILKRDRYTCQSCGARAPEVEVEVDHKIPVSRGGTDEESNLTTLCKGCNSGKSNHI